MQKRILDQDGSGGGECGESKKQMNFEQKDAKCSESIIKKQNGRENRTIEFWHE